MGYELRPEDSFFTTDPVNMVTFTLTTDEENKVFILPCDEYMEIMNALPWYQQQQFKIIPFQIN